MISFKEFYDKQNRKRNRIQISLSHFSKIYTCMLAVLSAAYCKFVLKNMLKTVAKGHAFLTKMCIFMCRNQLTFMLVLVVFWLKEVFGDFLI